MSTPMQVIDLGPRPSQYIIQFKIARGVIWSNHLYGKRYATKNLAERAMARAKRSAAKYGYSTMYRIQEVQS